MNVGDVVDTTSGLGKVEIASLHCATGDPECPGFAVYELLPSGARRYEYATRCVVPDQFLTAEPVRFEVGKLYAVRSLGDYEHMWTFKVTKRTAKTVTIESTTRGAQRRGISISTWREGQQTEYIKPFGTYSLSPTLCATDSWDA